MDIKQYNNDGITIIKLSGKLDANSSTAVQEKIMSHVTNGCKLIIDMTSCNYVSSAGLRALLIIAKHLAQVGGYGVLTGIIEEVKDVLEMTGFSDIFKCFDSIEEAKNELGKEKI